MNEGLPPGWARTTLGEVVDIVPLTGLKLPQGEYEEAGPLPVVDQGQRLVGGYTSREDLRIQVTCPVIVFGDHTKAIKYVDFDFVAGADGIKPLVPREVYFPKLFYYFLQALRLPDKGYARHYQFLAKSSLPLPPLPEQRRIVAKIEELFSKLDAGVEELKKARAQLKRYRQSVLKAAFEGRLTSEWRLANSGKLEPAVKLLERIREERKKALGKKYKEPPPLDTSDLPDLPEGWAWARLGELADSMLGKMLDKAKHTTGSLLPYLRNVNVRWGYVDADNLAKMYFKASETERYSVKAGDVLVCEGGEPGRAAVWDGRIENMRFQKALHRVRPTAGILPKWLVLHLQNDAGQGLLERYFTGSTIKHFTGEGLGRYAVRVSTTAEQREIVAAVEERLSVADAEEKAIEAALRQAGRLRQSILKRAFEGRLVPQDPADEPATELLERIRAEKVRLCANKSMRGQAKRETGLPRGRGRRR